MKNNSFYFLMLLLMQISFAQNKPVWQGYFSYNEIKGISESATTVFAASENALFSKNSTTNLIKTTNTIDGLSGQTISALYHSVKYNKTIVGYKDGLLILVNENDGTVKKFVDIITKQLPSEIKKINHFLEYEGFLYISCDFGIVQFNLNTQQFGDTYFMGANGLETKVNQTAIYNGFIYAATDNGIRSAAIENQNLIDFNQWTTINTGIWIKVIAFGSDLYAINNLGNIHKFNLVSNNFIAITQLPQPALDTRFTSGYFIVTTLNNVYVYNNEMVLIRQIKSNQVLQSTLTFTCATIIGDTVFIGTKEEGMLTTPLSTVAAFENSTPSGPSRNNIFSLQATSKSLWTVYGDYSVDYNPYPLDSYGLSKFSEKGWLNIPYQKVFNAKSISSVTINPNNENQVYASSFFSGLLKIENDEPTILYNQTNSGLESLTFAGANYIDIRVNGTAFDKSGNLWVTTSRITNGLKVLKTNGQWQSYAMDGILDSAIDNNFGAIVIDKNGTKWLATSLDGVVAFNESNNKFKKITMGSDTGNLPAVNVRTIAVDNKNQLWIGTMKGLRVLPNVGSFQTEGQMTAKPIIILEDGLAQELLYEQFITSIAVDGANNKWIGTADSGVFLVSPNGQETKYHFTINNSPLPSNTINAITINSVTGEVFIATAKGLISFKGTATAANDDLSNSYVYPNPVRPEYTGTVKIAGLLDKANVKITDIGGNLVYETTAQGGTIEWDTTAFGKYKVATGVYMIFISAQDGAETKVKKVMIIR
ncbi:T9SS type A sorting domain-containing protein [Flavobacterium sp. P4023]|uniref:T9SS type A sorting domain-containing protein n=1 Tax=Flavobacterium flabelliforme TaxID=2816119 RepID=A0ABS5CRT6_9FLAO|nr:two-component regulator propeller domain-containing protein [Flavobacterium flabelliforme]MBP4141321.1 T9SS type A sorting domain-containing protein [Flavobacterium flabelliforme]